jgi:hypothetical protein
VDAQTRAILAVDFATSNHEPPHKPSALQE